MRFGYFLLKITGTDGHRMEDWDLVDFTEVPLDTDDPASTTTAEAIASLTTWADERLAAHAGYYELFNACLASRDEEEGYPHQVIAEEYRVMLSGKRLNTTSVMNARNRALVGAA